MTKRTAKQRIERAVEKEYQKWMKGNRVDGWLNIAMAVTMAERARLKRGVRNLDKGRLKNDDQDYGYHKAINDILALWEG